MRVVSRVMPARPKTMPATQGRGFVVPPPDRERGKNERVRERLRKIPADCLVEARGEAEEKRKERRRAAPLQKKRQRERPADESEQIDEQERPRDEARAPESGSARREGVQHSGVPVGRRLVEVCRSATRVERHVVEELTVVADLTRRGDVAAVDDLARAGALREEDRPHEDASADRLSPNRARLPRSTRRTRRRGSTISGLDSRRRTLGGVCGVTWTAYRGPPCSRR